MLNRELKTEKGKYGVEYTVVPVYCLRASQLFEYRFPSHHIYAPLDIKCPHCGSQGKPDWANWHVINPSQALLSRLLAGGQTNA